MLTHPLRVNGYACSTTTSDTVMSDTVISVVT